MINIEYFDKGKDKTIVMVHGLTQSRKIYNKQVEYFNDHYNLVLVDLRGHGSSSDLPGPFGIKEYTDDLEDVLKSLSLEQVIFWGTHTGSSIGLNLFLRNRQYISVLIFESIVIPGFHTPYINSTIGRTRNILEDAGLEEAIDEWLINSKWFKYMRDNPKECRYFDHKKIIEEFSGNPWLSELIPERVENAADRLGEIDIPVLAYNGQHDLEEFYNMTKALSANLNVTVKVIEDAGGFPLWENPEIVNSVIFKWLQKGNK